MVIGETKLKILIAALTPSRYTDLAKASGVSKTMFDRHLDDLVGDGLIEKTDEGLYMITTKGVELLMKLKVDEGRDLIEDIKRSLLPRKKVSEEVKHCWNEIGKLYGEYLLNIIDVALSKPQLIDKIDNDETLASYIVDLENLIDTSFSLGVYIAGRLRDFLGRLQNPVADYLRRILSIRPEKVVVRTKEPASMSLPLELSRISLNIAEKKLESLLNEVNILIMASKDDQNLRLVANYLKFRLENLRTLLTKMIEYYDKYGSK